MENAGDVEDCVVTMVRVRVTFITEVVVVGYCVVNVMSEDTVVVSVEVFGVWVVV
jgi:hypothetical protein